MTQAITLSAASMSDLSYIDYLQRKNAEELSFYPMSVFEREIGNARIILARLNDEPAGYLYHGSLSSSVLKIHQACIEYDLRGYLYGSALVNWLIDLARVSNCDEISLRCGSDIAANGFWQAMGFHCISVTPGGARRMRDINQWRYSLKESLFSIEVEASSRAQSSSAWTRARKEGLSLKSQFMRGRDLRTYREEILLLDKSKTQHCEEDKQ